MDKEQIERKISNIESNMRDITQILANLNQKDPDGKTPLHRACEQCDEEMIRMLLKNHAVLHCVANGDNETPLHLAVKNGHLRAVELLLRDYESINKQYFLNAKTKTKGYTSLHMAVEMGRRDIVKSLLKYRVRIDVQDESGKTAAELTNDEEIIELFDLIEKFRGMAQNRKIIQELRKLKPDVLLAVTNANVIQGHSIYVELMVTSRYGSFHREAWTIIYTAKKKDRQDFEATMYMDRSVRGRG